MSRIRQAICARFAASATRFKSRRNVSVPACFVGCGRGGTNFCDGDECDPIDDDIELLWAALGDEMGASILFGSFAEIDQSAR